MSENFSIPMPSKIPLLPKNPSGTAFHFINGAFTASSDSCTFDSVNPANGEVLCKVALGGAVEIDLAVAAADRAWREGPWSKTTATERAVMLRKIGDELLARKQEFAELESLDSGKPLSETLNADIPRAAFNFHFYADLCNHQMYLQTLTWIRTLIIVTFHILFHINDL